MFIHCKLLYSCLGIWLLIFELVARESQQFETLVSILLVRLNHPRVVGGGQSSLGGDVNEEDCPLASHK